MQPVGKFCMRDVSTGEQHHEPAMWSRYMSLLQKCVSFLILLRLQVTGLARKANYSGRFEKLMTLASGVFNKLVDRAADTPRNYILDQTKYVLPLLHQHDAIRIVSFPLGGSRCRR